MRKVEFRKEIKTTPQQIISAFTEPDMLKEWWGVERSLIEKTSGGVYTLAWNISENGFGYISTGTVSEYKPDRIIIENMIYLNPERPMLGPMRLTVKATPKNRQTEIYLCQDGYGEGPDWDWYYEAVKQAWPTVLETLKNYLEEREQPSI